MQTTVTFANTTSIFPANTLKLAIQIHDWPFQSLRNSLEIILGSKEKSKSSTPDACTEFQATKDENQDLKWFTLNVNGNTLYGQFENRAIVDELQRKVNFTLSDDNFVIAKLPHFWNSAVVDPSYSVLLSSPPDGCHKKKKVNIVAIVVPIAVVVILVAGIFLIPQVRTKLTICFKKREISHSESSSHLKGKSEVEFDKINSMEVHSNAGNFRVQL
eukprot:Phypoly_transcript_16546.p1 GENE.Phypoly_transcript_16546~~Phypoly_transcript_16546.p1  ORF type:complete len:216 (+),score=36.38 Phypoly_transcript_16546:186-833(+)